MFIQSSSVRIGVELSWDGGVSWTARKDQTFTNRDPLDAVKTYGSTIDTWGHTWTPDELSDANFRVRLTLVSFGGRAQSLRCDSVKVSVRFTAPDQKLEGAMKTQNVVLVG